MGNRFSLFVLAAAAFSMSGLISAEALPWLNKKKKEPEAPPVVSTPASSWALGNDPAYGAGFQRFGYVSSYAEVGGNLKIGEIGAFEGHNPYASHMQRDRRLSGDGRLFEPYVFESLMVRGRDEEMALYAHIATTIEVASDLSFVGFTLNPAAKFSDGQPISAEDVIFSFEAAKKFGPPDVQADLQFVEPGPTDLPGRVRFNVSPGASAQLPATLGLLPILPKHVYAEIDLSRAKLKVQPVGSGPYIVQSTDIGNNITYRRRSDYWAASLPTRRGHFNFNYVTVTYFKQREDMLKALDAGNIQLWVEENAALWETDFNFFKVRSGIIYKEEFPRRLKSTPAGSGSGLARIARWVDVDRPQRYPLDGPLIDTWWGAETH